MLTSDQRASFATEGVVKLPAALEPDDAREICDAVWEYVATDQGIERHDPSTWTTVRLTGFNRLSRTGALDRVWNPTVHETLSDLLGDEPLHRERLRVLMTLPQSDQAWSVPSDAWHFDYTPAHNQSGLRAVQLFALLSDVGPQGGGTLILAGSHHLVSRYVSRTKHEPRPKLVRGDLGARHPWLAELWGGRGGDQDRAGRTNRFLGVPAVVDDVDLRVTEVTGTAGDVYIMNSDCFHAMAPNTLDVARVMCTSLVTRAVSRR